jgi:hypothetical protein
MTLVRTRLIAAAAVFAANLALSLSYGTAEAQAPRHPPRQVSHRPPKALAEAGGWPAQTAPVTMKPTSANPGCDVPWFCDFPGAN